MSIPVPNIRYVKSSLGTMFRIRTFVETETWSAGDLVNIDGVATIFISITLCDREDEYTGKWESYGCSITVVDDQGISELTPEEFDSAQLITRFKDVA